jgi:hypothetical protein
MLYLNLANDHYALHTWTSKAVKDYHFNRCEAARKLLGAPSLKTVTTVQKAETPRINYYEAGARSMDMMAASWQNIKEMREERKNNPQYVIDALVAEAAAMVTYYKGRAADRRSRATNNPGVTVQLPLH